MGDVAINNELFCPIDTAGIELRFEKQIVGMAAQTGSAIARLRPIRVRQFGTVELLVRSNSTRNEGWFLRDVYLTANSFSAVGSRYSPGFTGSAD